MANEKGKGKTTSAPAPPTSPQDLPLAPLPVSPHPHSTYPSLWSVCCSSHPRVATLVAWMKSLSIFAPLGMKRRVCSVVSLVIPACRLSSWYSLQPRSRCLILWAFSEQWHCVGSYGGRRIRKGLKYPCPSRSWWVVEAVVWSVLVMSFVGSQLGPSPSVFGLCCSIRDLWPWLSISVATL